MDELFAMNDKEKTEVDAQVTVKSKDIIKQARIKFHFRPEEME